MSRFVDIWEIGVSRTILVGSHYQTTVRLFRRRQSHHFAVEAEDGAFANGRSRTQEHMAGRSGRGDKRGVAVRSKAPSTSHILRGHI